MKIILAFLSLALFSQGSVSLASGQQSEGLYANCLSSPFYLERTQSAPECSDAYELSAPFLTEYRDKRKDQVITALGNAFINSILDDLTSLSDIDSFYGNLGADFAVSSTGSCDLKKLEENFPCKKEGNANLLALTGGKTGNLSDFLKQIKTDYLNKVKPSVSQSMNSCLSPATRRKIMFDKFLVDNNEFNLKELLDKREEQVALNEEERDFLFNLEENYLGGIVNLSPELFEGIEASSLREQLEKFVHQGNAKGFEAGVAKKCNEMLERVYKVVCKPINHDRVDNKYLNEKLFSYISEDHTLGFDEFSASIQDVPLEESYANFALNCSPICEDCSEEITVDKIISESFPDTLEKYLGSEYNLNHPTENIELDREICPLLACENGRDVQAGANCRALPTIRGLESLRHYVGCADGGECESEEATRLNSYLSSIYVDKFTPSSFTQALTGVKSVNESDSSSENSGSDNIALTPVGNSTGDSLKPPQLSDDVKARLNEDRPRAEKLSSVTNEKYQRPRTTQSNYTSASVAPLASEESAPEDFDSEVLEAMKDYMKSSNRSMVQRDRKLDGKLENLVQDNNRLSDSLERKFGQDFGGSDFFTNDNTQSSGYRGNNFLPNIPYPVASHQGDGFGNESFNSTRESTPLSSEWDGTGRRESDSLKNRGNASRVPSSIPNGAVQDFGKVEFITNPLGLPGVSSETVLNEGIDVSQPFMILVKVEKRLIKVPVRPYEVNGKRMLAPVIDEENVILVDLLRKSPLFKDYYALSDSKKSPIFTLNN